MHEFSSTKEVITFYFADLSIRSNTKSLVLEKLNVLNPIGSSSYSFVGVIVSHTPVPCIP